jgi:hypothetical protein
MAIFDLLMIHLVLPSPASDLQLTACPWLLLGFYASNAWKIVTLNKISELID